MPHQAGDDVYQFWLDLQGSLAKRNLNADLYPFPYEQAPHALGLPILISHDISGGSTLLTHYVQARRARCSTTNLVVAGQSEGAAVVHWAYPTISAAVRAVVLFGDPLRMPGAPYDQALGAQGPPSLGLLVGLMDVSFRDARLHDSIPPDSAQVTSYCLKDDPICGFNRTYPGSHLSYRNAKSVLDSATAFAIHSVRGVQGQD